MRNDMILHLRYLTRRRSILASGKITLSPRDISSPFLFVIRPNENITPGKNDDIRDNKICMYLTSELQKLFSPWPFYKGRMMLNNICLWTLRKSPSSKYWIGIILCGICNCYENYGFILLLCSILLYVYQASQFCIDFVTFSVSENLRERWNLSYSIFFNNFISYWDYVVVLKFYDPSLSFPIVHIFMSFHYGFQSYAMCFVFLNLLSDWKMVLS